LAARIRAVNVFRLGLVGSVEARVEVRELYPGEIPASGGSRS
jgi:hypothetical protein